GIYFNRARYYDPAVGRFISPDPITGSPQQPANHNRYAYAANAPTRYSDPFGLEDTAGKPAALPAGTGFAQGAFQGGYNNAFRNQAPGHDPQGLPSAFDPANPPQIRVRPDPNYRITDPEGLGLSREAADALVAKTEARIQSDPNYVSQNPANADPAFR